MLHAGGQPGERPGRLHRRGGGVGPAEHEQPKVPLPLTSSSSADAIQRSGKLKRSAGAGDCALGEGVYFTAKAPRSSSASLLANNYEGAASSYGGSHVEAYVRVDAHKVKARSGRDTLGRDVFVVPGNVRLDKANTKVARRA